MSFEKFNDILESNSVPFKDVTDEGDIILIVLKHTMLWAMVYSIGDEDDRGLREVIIKFLSIPPLRMNLYLTDEQLDGEEKFIIESTEAYMKAIDFSQSLEPEEVDNMQEDDFKIEKDDKGNIIVIGNKTLN